jgi:transposase
VGGRAELPWLARFRRLAKDYERLASTLKGVHLAAFAIVMPARLVNWTENA